MSDNVGSVASMSGVVTNVRVAYRIASLSLPVQKLGLFGIRHLEIRMSLDMSRDQCYSFVCLSQCNMVWATVLNKDNVFVMYQNDIVSELM